jgi:hypothetical protein
MKERMTIASRLGKLKEREALKIQHCKGYHYVIANKGTCTGSVTSTSVSPGAVIAIYIESRKKSQHINHIINQPPHL